MRPRILDVCCGAGGMAVGYHRAGFDVVGVDINPQPNYPFEFHQGDGIEFIKAHAREFDAIHASWPCGRYTTGAKQHGTQDNHPDLIGPGRAAMLSAGLPYVIENVDGARPDLRDPFLLCGQYFDLGVFRHRLFETSWRAGVAIPHQRHVGRVGDGRFVTVAGKPGGYSNRDGIQHGNAADWRRAMGIGWMTAKEMAQAIPPAYGEYVGLRLLAHLTVAHAAIERAHADGHLFPMEMAS